MTTSRTPAQGVFLIDKPLGWTSHDAVARLRRVLSQKKTGHAGTLDPLATGVLVVCAGAATKALEAMVGHDKTYVAGVVLGVESETCDAEGPLRTTGVAAPISPEAVAAVLGRLVADYVQVPPRHSAKKIDGQAAYKIARAGGDPKLEGRRVSLRSFKLLDFVPNDPEPGLARLSIRVEVSTGFYVRSLARDLGEALGCGGYLSSLVRETVGRFRLDQCARVDDARDHPEAVRERLLAGMLGLDEAYADLPALDLPPALSRRVELGQANGFPLAEARLADQAELAPAQLLWLRGDDGFRALGRLARREGSPDAVAVEKRLGDAHRAAEEFRREAASERPAKGAV